MTSLLAATLRAERAANRMTVAALAAASGMAERTVIRHLAGERPVTVGQLDAYARALGTTGSRLMAAAEQRGIGEALTDHLRTYGGHS